jgi:hypothetical protein
MGAAWAWHDMCELASVVQRQHVGDLPVFSFFRLPRRVPRRLLPETYQFVLNCRTSSSAISGYHANSHEGYGTVGECHERGMAFVN